MLKFHPFPIKPSSNTFRWCFVRCPLLGLDWARFNRYVLSNHSGMNKNKKMQARGVHLWGYEFILLSCVSLPKFMISVLQSAMLLRVFFVGDYTRENHKTCPWSKNMSCYHDGNSCADYSRDSSMIMIYEYELKLSQTKNRTKWELVQYKMSSNPT
jgi:hypothetical protein